MTTIAINIEQMREAAGQATAMLRVLANEDRLLMLCQLTQGEACVSELEESVGIRQPTLSQQLGVLRTEGIGSTRREGKKICYQLNEGQALALLKPLHGWYCPGEPDAAGSQQPADPA